jgi:ribonuclease VapC
MMVLASSAIVAILRGEAEADNFIRLVVEDHDSVVSAVNYQESGQVKRARGGTTGLLRFEEFLTLTATRVLPYTIEHAAAAISAFARFGKGMGHPAQLNFCDCAAYSLAMSLDAQLLFQGGDFEKTDVWRAR